MTYKYRVNQKTGHLCIALTWHIQYNVHYTNTVVFEERTFVKERYYLVREDILPEAVVKTMQVKKLLASGDVRTVHEAVEQVGLSRSAFYKYKDGIHPINQLERDEIVTISIDMEHRSGMLSEVLGLVAGEGGNVLTIHQSIPLQGIANVVISVEVSRLNEELDDLLDGLRRIAGVRRVQMIGQG
nr:ACT domain-containing protein [Paenibacillus lautus]